MMKRFHFVLAALLAFSSVFAGSNPLQQAWDLSWKGDYKGAVKEYRAFAKSNPDDPQAAVALYNAANISLTQMGKKDEAGKLFSQLVEKYPETRWTAESYRQLSLLALDKKQPKKAADYFRQALKSARTNDYQMPETWIASLAQDWRDRVGELGDPALAVDMYREVLQVMPPGESAAQTQYDLAGMLKTAGQEAEASALLAEIMTCYPHTRWAAKSMQEERDLVSRYTPDFPWDDVKAMNSANSLARAGNFTAADSIYAVILAKHPGSDLAQNALFGKIGTELYLSGDFQAAVNRLRDFSARYPKAYRQRDLERRLDAWGDIARMEDALKDDPQDYTTHCAVGTTQMWMRFLTQAESHFRTAIKIDSLQSYPYFMLGEVLNGRDDQHSALKSYQKYLSLDPTGAYSAPAKAAVDSLSVNRKP